MKAIKDNLSVFDEVHHNAADAPGFYRAGMGKGKPNAARIYSVYKIESRDGIEWAYCQCRNAWGQMYHDILNLATLVPYEP